jgi:hypothetical protein
MGLKEIYNRFLISGKLQMEFQIFRFKFLEEHREVSPQFLILVSNKLYNNKTMKISLQSLKVRTNLKSSRQLTKIIYSQNQLRLIIEAQLQIRIRFN